MGGDSQRTRNPKQPEPEWQGFAGPCISRIAERAEGDQLRVLVVPTEDTFGEPQREVHVRFRVFVLFIDSMGETTMIGVDNQITDRRSSKRSVHLLATHGEHFLTESMVASTKGDDRRLIDHPHEVRR